MSVNLELGSFECNSFVFVSDVACPILFDGSYVTNLLQLGFV